MGAAAHAGSAGSAAQSHCPAWQAPDTDPTPSLGLLQGGLYPEYTPSARAGSLLPPLDSSTHPAFTPWPSSPSSSASAACQALLHESCWLWRGCHNIPAPSHLCQPGQGLCSSHSYPPSHSQHSVVPLFWEHMRNREELSQYLASLLDPRLWTLGRGLNLNMEVMFL